MNAPADAIDAAEARLRTWIRAQGAICVCLSGGVDSSLLAHLAAEELGGAMMAITGLSASLAPDERDDIRAFCTKRQIRWATVDTDELNQPGYIENTPDRCYHCKNELYGRVVGFLAEAADDGMTVIDGTHHGDLSGHRPGLRAATEHGVRSPLVELELGKDIVRGLADKHGLENADRPSAPCLSSRIAYGVAVTEARLDRVGNAERALKALGFDALRVRLHDEVARIEIPKRQLAEAVDKADAIVAAVRDAGFTWVTLDLAGLRSGSLLEVIQPASAPTSPKPLSPEGASPEEGDA
jgi:uncharacterized protein